MRIRIAVLAVSVLVAAVLGTAVVRSTDEAWRAAQRRYLELSSEKGAGPAAAQPVEIRQDRLVGYGEERIDRCRSCHLAVDDPRFAGGEQPLRTHPSIAPHQFNQLGCTVCHEGEGRALTAALAHGEDPFWPEPLLPAPFIEASCARCHPAPYLAQTPHLRRGRALFERYGCVGCHTVQGLSRGSLGLELTDVGAHRKVDFLLAKIERPRATVPQTLMPTFPMPKEDRVDLVVFLKSLRGRALAEDPVSAHTRIKRWKNEAPPEVEPTVEAGHRAVEARGCVSCHKLGEADGLLAPDLGHLGQLRDEGYVAAHLLDPRAHTPGSNMPGFWMSPGERQAIALYLTSLGGLELPPGRAEQYALLCARCHGEKGGGDGPIASNLLPRPRAFTNARFFNWLPEERAHRAIRDGVPGTAMPPFGKLLDEAGAQALFAWVRVTFIGAERTTPVTKRRVPESNPVAFSAASVERGRQAFAARCYGCHGRAGDGRGPNAAEMLPRPRNLAGREFLAPLSDARLYESITYGIVGTGMPAWDSLPEDQRWDLVNFVRSLSSTGPAASKGSKP
ncbi:MAG: c-type cytochrome [Myxococcaceae bacterium]